MKLSTYSSWKHLTLILTVQWLREEQLRNTSSCIFVLGSSITAPHAKQRNPFLETSKPTQMQLLLLFFKCLLCLFQFEGSKAPWFHHFSFTLTQECENNWAMWWVVIKHNEMKESYTLTLNTYGSTTLWTVQVQHMHLAFQDSTIILHILFGRRFYSKDLHWISRHNFFSCIPWELNP